VNARARKAPSSGEVRGLVATDLITGGALLTL
jgi:hypothetical protein